MTEREVFILADEAPRDAVDQIRADRADLDVPDQVTHKSATASPADTVPPSVLSRDRWVTTSDVREWRRIGVGRRAAPAREDASAQRRLPGLTGRQPD
jgi:hypothetical protein